MKRIGLIIFILTAASLALVAKGRQDSASGPGTASGEGRTIKISYNIRKINEGSRSEGRYHELAVNGYVLPDVFELVYAANVRYDFKTADQAWDDGGYVMNREEKGNAPFEKTDNPIADKDWELGWYEGNKQKEGTPRSWVYIERDKLKAFVNPDEIDRFIRYEDLEEMARLKLETKKQ